MMTRFWAETDKGDPRCRALADRHYSRQTPGHPMWTRPGYNQVLYSEDSAGGAVFVWWRPKWESGVCRRDGLHAIECTIFRNESSALSSDLVIDALSALQCWQYADRLAGIITSVNSEATSRRRSRRSRPGECFRRAGFVDIEHRPGRGDVWLAYEGLLPMARRPPWEPRRQMPLFAAEVGDE